MGNMPESVDWHELLRVWMHDPVDKALGLTACPDLQGIETYDLVMAGYDLNNLRVAALIGAKVESRINGYIEMLARRER